MSEALRGGASAAGLLAALELVPGGDGHFRAEIDPGWTFRGKPNGGYLMALATRAAVVGGDGRKPLGVSTSFVGAPSAGPVDVAVETVRAGRSVAHVSVRISQDNKPVVHALVACGDLRDDAGADWSGARLTPVAPFADCTAESPRPGILERLGVRYDPDTDPRVASLSPGDAGEAEVRGWIEFLDAESPEAEHVIVAADMLAATIAKVGLGGWAPTVQMSTYLRAVPAPGPLAVSVRAGLVRGGWFDEIAEVCDSRGVVVGQARQLAMVGIAAAAK